MLRPTTEHVSTLLLIMTTKQAYFNKIFSVVGCSIFCCGSNGQLALVPYVIHVAAKISKFTVHVVVSLH